MSKAAIVRNYAVSILWPSGHHYFEPEFFDDLTDARDRERHLNSTYAARVKDGTARAKSMPTVHVWARQPNVKTLTASRAPRRVSRKPRTTQE